MTCQVLLLDCKSFTTMYYVVVSLINRNLQRFVMLYKEISLQEFQIYIIMGAVKFATKISKKFGDFVIFLWPPQKILTLLEQKYSISCHNFIQIPNWNEHLFSISYFKENECDFDRLHTTCLFIDYSKHLSSDVFALQMYFRILFSKKDNKLHHLFPYFFQLEQFFSLIIHLKIN